MELCLPLELFMGCQATCQVVFGTCSFFQRMHFPLGWPWEAQSSPRVARELPLLPISQVLECQLQRPLPDDLASALAPALASALAPALASALAA